MRGEDYMKKKIIIISILVVVVVVLLLIPKDVYKKIFKKDNSIKNNVTEELVYETLFVKNDKDCLVGIKVGVKKLEEDGIAQKWDLLTKNVSSLPSGYTSPINVSAVLYSHVVENNSLVLKYRYKEGNGEYTDWTTLTPTITDNTFTYTELLENLSCFRLLR